MGEYNKICLKPLLLYWSKSLHQLIWRIALSIPWDQWTYESLLCCRFPSINCSGCLVHDPPGVLGFHVYYKRFNLYFASWQAVAWNVVGYFGQILSFVFCLKLPKVEEFNCINCERWDASIESSALCRCQLNFWIQDKRVAILQVP